MRKRMMTLAAVAILAITLTACGAAQTGNNPTPTVEPTKEAEATTAPTVEPTKEAEVTTTPTVEPTATNVPEPTATSTPTPEPTATPEPTSTPTPEPTATPVPTSTPTPEPTATPVPTEAPKADTKDWKTVLRELHSLETYAEREAYVAKLDKSAYKIEKTENFDLINKCNSGEVEISKEILVGYNLISNSTDETVAEYTVDTLPEEYLDAAYFEDIIEHAEYGVCYFEKVYTYETNTVNAKAALDIFVPKHFDTFGNYDEVEKPAYLMTITNTATGETDPWGVVGDETIFDYDTFEHVPIALTFERVIDDYNWCVGQLPDGEWAFEQVLYHYVNENGPLHPIETWDTLKYYEDLEHTTPAKFWW